MVLDQNQKNDAFLSKLDVFPLFELKFEIMAPKPTPKPKFVLDPMKIGSYKFLVLQYIKMMLMS